MNLAKHKHKPNGDTPRPKNDGTMIGGTMPLHSGSSKKVMSENFDEFRHGPTFKRTKEKFGKERAAKQMRAVVLSNARKGKKMGGKNQNLAGY